MCYLVQRNAYFILLRRNQRTVICMEKEIVLTLLILYWLGMHSQVEINISCPDTTQNIGRNSMRPTILDSIINGVQRKTKKYNSAERKIFVFATNADNASSGQTLNITSSG